MHLLLSTTTELPRTFISLLTNPIYICVTLSATLETAVITGNLTFIPKYLQAQFGLDTTYASILTGECWSVCLQ